MIKDKSSIYLSIFKRKGGEGIKTKIINRDNENQFKTLFSNLSDQEKPLITFFENISNWILLTNNRIIINKQDSFSFVKIDEIIEVVPALKEELKNDIYLKNNFTKLKLGLKNNDNVILDLEQGLPYEGLYQVLHFIKSDNISSLL
ncbi:hypothetical protein ACNFU2_20600 [Chryseobacterium sp. PTM-20240506]|uniref:hypothetical protein n=1 Tax=unclassified Chryseobacterium TaxID=2593645 RepID=UPI0023591AD7|nr:MULTISPECIES: hypothetical protein [unclassified Chryseobacterium]MDC8102989.1 hypothetical protein [Chryseobacterium sp. B21-037]MDQ1802537.1 hypothetical protein [Chryseobacterium sp. CKR4-1]